MVLASRAVGRRVPGSGCLSRACPAHASSFIRGIEPTLPFRIYSDLQQVVANSRTCTSFFPCTFKIKRIVGDNCGNVTGEVSTNGLAIISHLVTTKPKALQEMKHIYFSWLLLLREKFGGWQLPAKLRPR